MNVKIRQAESSESWTMVRAPFGSSIHSPATPSPMLDILRGAPTLRNGPGGNFKSGLVCCCWHECLLVARLEMQLLISY